MFSRNNRRHRKPQSCANKSLVKKEVTWTRTNPLKLWTEHSSVSFPPELSQSNIDTFKEILPTLIRATFNFDTQLLAVECASPHAYRIEVKTCNISCNDFKMAAFKKDDVSFMINLSDRHPLYTNLVLKLKLNIKTDVTGTETNYMIHIKYNLKIPYFRIVTNLEFTKLKPYDPSEETTQEFYKKTREDSYSAPVLASVKYRQSYNRTAMFTDLAKAVTFEDLQSRENLKHLSLNDVEIQGGLNRYYITTSTTRAIIAERWREMSMCLVPMEKYDQVYNHPNNCYYVQIDNIFRNTIKIDTQKYLESIPYHVDFNPNRIGVRACHNALECMRSRGFTYFLQNFNNEPIVASSKIAGLQLKPITHFDWSNTSIANNFEQKLAIKNIINCTAYPCPQIVFGPPGTGKTTTLVECVLQILKLRPECRVLITTQSNSACDEIGVRLLKYVSNKAVYRFYSPAMLNPTAGKLNSQLKKSSNLRYRKVQWPTKEELRYFKVVISTLITSSRLAKSSIGDEFFDYIFVDEISCATEPEALVPIIGLGTLAGKVTSNIILLGDHKQLGPVLTCEKLGAELGLGVSLMERMMNSCTKYAKQEPHLLKSVYQKHPYDDRYVVQLLDNYRSHPAILKFSSDQFYDGSLRPKMELNTQQMTESWEFLPNRKFPVIFHAVKTKCKLDGTSSFNIGEIEMVKLYVKLLLMKKLEDHKIKENDIGIISPYLAQLKRLKDIVGSIWPGIEMGTAEYFQGREKPVIIISTVKSQGGVGFLSNEKRCNVMLTRAKFFEVVIGNNETLSQDAFWCKFIEYCNENESFTHRSERDMEILCKKFELGEKFAALKVSKKQHTKKLHQ